jgi:hypothetical protein
MKPGKENLKINENKMKKEWIDTVSEMGGPPLHLKYI